MEVLPEFSFVDFDAGRHELIVSSIPSDLLPLSSSGEDFFGKFKSYLLRK